MPSKPGRPKNPLSRRLADSCPALKVVELRRQGYLRESVSWMKLFPAHSMWVSGQRNEERLELVYGQAHHDGGPEQTISLTTTTCHLGGTRTWFVCPGAGEDACGRRVGVLFLVRGHGFACRACHNLTYESQRQQPVDRSIAQALKIRVALWDALDARGRREFEAQCGIFETLRNWPSASIYLAPQRPPGMRLRRYLNLRERHSTRVLCHLRLLNEQMRRHQDRLEARILRERQHDLDRYVRNARREAKTVSQQTGRTGEPLVIRVRERRGDRWEIVACFGPDGKPIGLDEQLDWPEVEWESDAAEGADSNLDAR